MLLTIANRSFGGNQSGLDSFIYGQAASMVKSNVMTMLVLAFVVLLVVFLAYKEWKIFLFDPQFAKGIGLSIRGMSILYTSVLVIAIVIGIQAVGVILMAALLIIPAVTSLLDPIVSNDAYVISLVWRRIRIVWNVNQRNGKKPADRPVYRCRCRGNIYHFPNFRERTRSFASLFPAANAAEKGKCNWNKGEEHNMTYTAWILLTAALVGLSCGLIGVFLILRKTAMMADAISHTVLLGIVLAFLVTKEVSGPAMLLGGILAGLITAFLSNGSNR